MNRMGFRCKWCKWVDVCLRSSCISILVNGSSTEEFGIEKGVRQGDPLSHFLYILAAEGLNTIVSEAMANGVFRGVKVEVSGLRVNYSKSKLYGIGVDEMELNYMVRLMGCGFGDFPFTYLGIRVGEDMRRINAWNVVVDSLITCNLAMSMWDKIFNWWKVGRVNAFTIKEIFSYSENVNIPTSLARVWKAVIWTSRYWVFPVSAARYQFEVADRAHKVGSGS
ncbi:hypothetical protein Tco_1400664 [Tanacetum coccineum]